MPRRHGAADMRMDGPDVLSRARRGLARAACVAFHAIALPLLLPSVAAAQQSGLFCDGRVIREIIVAPQPPFVTGMLQRFQWLTRTINDLHTTTEPEVVRRLLLLKEGEVCSELQRAESERLLLAQPYLANARVLVFPDDSAGARVLVETVDEVTITGGLALSTSAPYLHGVRLGEDNVLGKGISAEVRWRDGREMRDEIGIRVTDYQFMHSPVILDVEALRRPLGSLWNAGITLPFLTDLQRFAWEVSGGFDQGYTRLVQGPELSVLSLGSQRQYGSVGAVVRVGEPGRLSLFGAAVSSERATTDAFPILIDGSHVSTLVDPRFMDAYPNTGSARANALWGVRNISFERVTGFDAMSGAQDMAEGFQLGVLAGRSLVLLGAREDDMFFSGDLYAGGGNDRSFITVTARAEGRQSLDTRAWDGIIGYGHARLYSRVHDRHTVRADVAWSGGWRARVPFQLTLGDKVGGMRGFRRSDYGGASRLVGRLEDRFELGQVQESFEMGVAAFVDVGRLWAGDVPYGVDVPWQASVGVSLLGAYPVGSQRLLRLDLAVPVTRSGDGGFEVRLSSVGSVRRRTVEPDDVERSRERALRPDVFSWP